MKTMDELIGKSLIDFYLEKRFDAKSRKDSYAVYQMDQMIRKTLLRMEHADFFLESTSADLLPAYQESFQKPEDFDLYERNITITKTPGTARKILDEFLSQGCCDKSREAAVLLKVHPLLEKTHVVFDTTGKTAFARILPDGVIWRIPPEWNHLQTDIPVLLEILHERCERFYLEVFFKKKNAIL